MARSKYKYTTPNSNRARRVNLPQVGAARMALRRGSLNQKLNEMSEEDTREWGAEVFQSLRARGEYKSAKLADNPLVKSKDVFSVDQRIWFNDGHRVGHWLYPSPEKPLEGS